MRSAPEPLVILRRPAAWGDLAAFSHVGLEREGNEDRFDASPDGEVFAVADGMGGHDDGEVAAEAAVRAACAGGGTVVQAVERAQRAVLPLARGRRHSAPGCTLVVVRVAPGGRSAEVGWVGDSRAYLWDGAWLAPLTRDHSLGRSLARCIGGGIDDAKPDVVTVDVRPGAWLLVCTDGLHGFVKDHRIAEALRVPTRAEALPRLLDAACRRGAPDNVTCVLARFA